MRISDWSSDVCSSDLDSAVWPVKTNSAFLLRALDHPDFVAGRVDTGLIGRDGDAMAAEPEPSPQALTNAAMAMVPRSLQAGFRLNAPDVRTAPFLLDGKRVEAEDRKSTRLNSSH